MVLLGSAVQQKLAHHILERLEGASLLRLQGPPRLGEALFDRGCRGNERAPLDYDLGQGSKRLRLVAALEHPGLCRGGLQVPLHPHNGLLSMLSVITM